MTETQDAPIVVRRQAVFVTADGARKELLLDCQNGAIPEEVNLELNSLGAKRTYVLSTLVYSEILPKPKEAEDDGSVQKEQGSE